MLWCLHGFLGHGSDWESFDLGIPTARPCLLGEVPTQSFSAWGRTFTAQVKAVDDAPLLLGYSMGGRLALHALLANPGLWRGAVIVSAHPGLSSDAERAARIESDEMWARRFLADPWEKVVADWQGQSIFGGRLCPLRREESLYSREALAAALRLWSLGRQEDLKSRLGDISCPVLWVVGQDDGKFATQAREATHLMKNCTLWEVPGCAHWVAWEKPREFEWRVGNFLEGVTTYGAGNLDID